MAYGYEYSHTPNDSVPRRAPHPCAVHGCSNLVYDGSRCTEHPLPRPRDDRPSSTARGYGYEWKVKVRDPFLKTHPYCVNPFGLHGFQVYAVVVNHKLPRRKGGTDDWNNLEGLCRRCDNKNHYIDGSKPLRMVGGVKKF